MRRIVTLACFIALMIVLVCAAANVEAKMTPSSTSSVSLNKLKHLVDASAAPMPPSVSDPSCYAQCYAVYSVEIVQCATVGPVCYANAATQYFLCSQQCIYVEPAPTPVSLEAPSTHSPKASTVTPVSSGLNPECYAQCYTGYLAALGACDLSPVVPVCVADATLQYSACTQRCMLSSSSSSSSSLAGSSAEVTSHRAVVKSSLNPQCYQSCYTTYQSAIATCSPTNYQCYQNAATAYATCQQGCATVKKAVKVEKGVMKPRRSVHDNFDDCEQVCITKQQQCGSSSKCQVAYNTCLNACQNAVLACMEPCEAAYEKAVANCLPGDWQCERTAHDALGVCSCGCSGSCGTVPDA